MASPISVQGDFSLNPQSVNKSAKQVQSAFNNIRINPQQLDKFNNSLGRITGQATEFQKSMDAATARVFAFGATAAVIQSISQSFKALISSTIQVEKRLIEINAIFGATEQQFSKFRKSIFEVAKNTEQTFTIVADGAAELARQGLSAEETAKRLNAALILTRVSGLDSVSSVNALTAAINGYTTASLSAEKIVNKLVAVDTAFAVSAKDLADAFQRAGSTAEDAGVNFDELLGIITAVQQKTARGGAVIGNALKSIFTRLSRSTTIEQLQGLGVAIDANQGGIQKLQALSNAIENIADPTQVSKIKELAGGVFQINVVSAALKDLSKENSLFTQATEKSAQATNEAYEKNEQLNKALSAQINALVVGMTDLAEKVGQVTLAPVISDLVELASKGSDFLNKAFSEENGIPLIKGFFEGIGKFIQGPGVILITGAFLNIFKIVSKFALQGFKDLTKLGSGQEKIKSIEQGIVNLLIQDETLRKKIASASLSQAEKEKLVIQAIKQENALLTEQQRIISSLAAASARAGVRGYNTSGGGFKGKGGKRFASGYNPVDGAMEVAEAISLGAPRSVQPQMGQGTIGGKRFLMNDAEVEIPNFMGGRDSAVIPMYAAGNIPRYSKGFTFRDLENRRKSDFFKSDGSFTSKKKEDAYNNSDEDVKKAIDKLRGTEGYRKGSLQNRLKINSSPFAFLTPNKNVTKNISSFLGTLPRGSGKPNLSYELTNIPVYGPKIPRNVDEAADPQDEYIKKNIRTNILDSAVRFGKLIDPKGTAPKRSDVARGLVKTKGSKGAINAAVGAAFEVAVSTSLGLGEEASIKNKADFDVRNINAKPELKKIFEIKGQNIGDYKVSSSRGNLESFAAKIIKEKKLQNEGLPIKRKARGHIPRKARGHIPRYANGSSFTGKGITASFLVPQILQQVQGAVTSSQTKNLEKAANTIEVLTNKINELQTESENLSGDALNKVSEEINQLKNSLKEAERSAYNSSYELDQTSQKFNKITTILSSVTLLTSQFSGTLESIGGFIKPLVSGASGKTSPLKVAVVGGVVVTGFEIGNAIGEFLQRDNVLASDTIEINEAQTKGEYLLKNLSLVGESIVKQANALVSGDFEGALNSEALQRLFELGFAAITSEENLIYKEDFNELIEATKQNNEAKNRKKPIKGFTPSVLDSEMRLFQIEQLVSELNGSKIDNTSLDKAKALAQDAGIFEKLDFDFRSLEEEISNIRKGNVSESAITRFLNAQASLIDSIPQGEKRDKIIEAIKEASQNASNQGKEEIAQRKKLNDDFLQGLKETFNENLRNLETLNTNKDVISEFRNTKSKADVADFFTKGGLSKEGVSQIIGAGKSSSGFAKGILTGAGTDITKAIFGDPSKGLKPTLPSNTTLSLGQKELFNEAVSGFDFDILDRISGFKTNRGRSVTQTGVNRVKAGLSNKGAQTIGDVGTQVTGIKNALSFLSTLNPQNESQVNTIKEVSTVLGVSLEKIESAVLANASIEMEQRKIDLLQSISDNTSPKSQVNNKTSSEKVLPEKSNKPNNPFDPSSPYVKTNIAETDTYKELLKKSQVAEAEKLVSIKKVTQEEIETIRSRKDGVGEELLRLEKVLKATSDALSNLPVTARVEAEELARPK